MTKLSKEVYFSSNSVYDGSFILQYSFQIHRKFSRDIYMYYLQFISLKKVTEKSGNLQTFYLKHLFGVN